MLNHLASAWCSGVFLKQALAVLTAVGLVTWMGSGGRACPPELPKGLTLYYGTPIIGSPLTEGMRRSSPNPTHCSLCQWSTVHYQCPNLCPSEEDTPAPGNRKALCSHPIFLLNVFDFLSSGLLHAYNTWEFERVGQMECGTVPQQLSSI